MTARVFGKVTEQSEKSLSNQKKVPSNRKTVLSNQKSYCAIGNDCQSNRKRHIAIGKWHRTNENDCQSNRKKVPSNRKMALSNRKRLPIAIGHDWSSKRGRLIYSKVCTYTNPYAPSRLLVILDESSDVGRSWTCKGGELGGLILVMLLEAGEFFSSLQKKWGLSNLGWKHQKNGGVSPPSEDAKLPLSEARGATSS